MNKINNIKTSVKLLLSALALILILQISLNVVAKREFTQAINESGSVRYNLQTDTMHSDSIVIQFN